MKTIKIPIKLQSDIKDLQRQCSIVIRYAYNRFKEGKNQKEIRLLCKDLKNINDLNSWLIQSCIMKAKNLIDTKQENIIFGGKFNFIQRTQNKISKKDYQNNRLLNIISQGEMLKNGNRMFDFRIIEDNQIIFKLNKKNHISIQLPKLKKNFKKELYELQELGLNKKLPISIEFNSEFIFITFEENLLYQKVENNLKDNRVLGLDLNPNYIGLNISEFDGEKQDIVYSCIFDISKLTQKLNKSSSSKEQKYQENKRKFELYQICKEIQNLALYWKCKKICIEDLNIRSKQHNKGKNFNRLVNNKWNRNIIYSNLRKRCTLNNIQFVEVNPIYSSFIGNLLNSKYPDQIAASIEISRRGYFKYIKNKFYPSLIKVEDLYDQWKKTTDQMFTHTYSSWKELFEIFKNLKVKYRILLSEKIPTRVFSLSNIKSNITLYSFI